MNIAVIVYSARGNTAALAAAIAEGAERAGATARSRRVPDVVSAESTSPAPATERPAAAKDPCRDRPLTTIDDLVRADGVAFGSPTRYGNTYAQLESFIDKTASLWLSGALVGKVAAPVGRLSFDDRTTGRLVGSTTMAVARAAGTG